MKNFYIEKTGDHFIKTTCIDVPVGQNKTVISHGKQCLFEGCCLFTKNTTNTYHEMVRGNIAHHFHFYSLLLF